MGIRAVLLCKFLNAAAFYEADVLILGGDLTGKGNSSPSWISKRAATGRG